MLKKALNFKLIAALFVTCHSVQIDTLNTRCCYLDSSGLYVERDSSNVADEDRFTSDNKIYRLRREFIFDYSIIKQGKSLQFGVQSPDTFDDSYNKNWYFVPKDSTDANMVRQVSFKLGKGVNNEFQSTAYYYMKNNGGSNMKYFSMSGIVENEMNVWMHPFRDKYFRILQLNPFPYIKKPFKVGNEWKWNLVIGSAWADDRWCEWNGRIPTTYTYRITDRATIDLPVGKKIECWVIEAIAQNSLGNTGLIAYYNEQLGFVKLDYINIDKSQVRMQLNSMLE